MRTKIAIASAFLILAGAATAGAQADWSTPDPETYRQLIVDSLATIEAAAGLEPTASNALAALPMEEFIVLYDATGDKATAAVAARALLDRAAAARDRVLADEPGPIVATRSTPYPPNYPEGGPYAALTLLGLVDSPDDRCDSDILDGIDAFLTSNKEFLYAAESVCNASSCDPTGIICLTACIPVEAWKIAVQVAEVPLRLCARQEGGVDSAEIEADYENGVNTLLDVADIDTGIATLAGDLTAHDLNIDGDLQAHDTNIDQDLRRHDAHIDADLAAHVWQLGVHDTEVQAKLDQIQFELDHAVETRRIHLQVLEIKNKRTYLITTTVGGLAVDVELAGIAAFRPQSGAFIDLAAETTMTPVATGAYVLDFDRQRPEKQFRLDVTKPGTVDLFGQLLFGDKTDG